MEAGLALLDGGLTADRLRTVLARFAGFWTGLETLIDEWSVTHPELARDLQWPRRRRTEILRQDLLRLGLTVRDVGELPLAQPPFAAPVQSAQVLGWLYVSEGSSLGGAVIDRSLRELVPGPAAGIRTFTPYLEGPGPMWRAYLDALESWTADDVARGEAVVRAARTGFEALANWLAPIAHEVAA